MRKVLITAFFTLIISALSLTSLYAVKAFFNPNPPPAVYSYNIPQGRNFTGPSYIVPNYVSPNSVPYYSSPYNNFSYYYNWQNPYLNNQNYKYPNSGYYFNQNRFNQNGSLIWIQPN